MKKSKQTEQKIMIAAGEIFSEKGYSAASTSEIAKRAGVSEGTVFRYFNTKKELLIRLVKYGVEMFSEDIAIKPLIEISKGEKNGEQYLYEVSMNRYDLWVRYKDLFRIVIHELSFHMEIKELFDKYICEKVEKILTVNYENYVRAGEFRDDIDSHSAIRNFSGMIFILFMEHSHSNKSSKEQMEKDIRVAIDIFINGVGKK